MALLSRAIDVAVEHAHLVTEVMEFWFGTAESAELGKRRKIWFYSDPNFDGIIRQRFGEANRLATIGELNTLMRTQLGTLTLIILLDQFSRNIFRGKTEAFANDPKALETAHYALAKGFDKGLLTVQKLFFYLPFEHAESLWEQEQSVKLFVQLGDAVSLQHALCHRDKILRFGRFPERNKALGRKSTPAEQAFLKHPFC